MMQQELATGEMVQAGRKKNNGKSTIVWADPPVRLHPLSDDESQRWLDELYDSLAENDLSEFRKELEDRQEISDFLGAVFSLSSYLRDLAIRDPDRLSDILCTDPEIAFDELLISTASGWKDTTAESELMTSLRKAKARAALICGLADLGGWWKPEKVTRALSEFADTAIGAAIDFLLLQLHESGKVELVDKQIPHADSGLIVIGMGKYGAFELNYSSDVDLILFFDDAGMKYNTDDPVSLMARFAKSLIRILQERTGDGYVFRVDLRLRPDPGSTPLVIPVETALNYYEAYGQNWERAALIKARAIAGDQKAGNEFLKELAPFVWRKYLDYAAISDVHSIKRQINSYRGLEDIAVAGHNVKLGQGGIREIEFFAQTQQLIAGGRLPELRCSSTLLALDRLTEEGWIDERARDELSEAYWYLRNVEHRIQMVADEQSHTLPEDEEGLKRIAYMMGYNSVDEFAADLTKTLTTVQDHYAVLFEASPELGHAAGNLVFTGDDEDPGTLQAISEIGFANPSNVIRIVRGWHFGRFPAVRTAQARELLTELTPTLLISMSQTGDADRTLAAFDRFLSGLPAGIQLFSLLKSNPSLMRLLMLILGSAPRLAEIITRQPHIFDGLLEPAFANLVPDRVMLAERLETALDHSNGYEDILDIARQFCAEQKFLIGARLINGVLTPEGAGRSFSNLAEVLIQAMVDRVSHEFENRHGKVDGARICVVGMGRLGSRELTAGSDLDLIFLYDHDVDAEFSDGEKPLAVSQYFIRLTQRLISAMSAPTAAGVLYELDFRLRPSGNAGPLATHVDSFLKYQRSEAWTWERLALTRARAIAGDQALRDQLEKEIEIILQEPCEPKKLAKDVREMRSLILKEKPAANIFDIKTAKGGLVDVEFIAQWSVLLSGLKAETRRHTAISEMIRLAGDEVLNASDREILNRALADYNSVLQILRLCIDGEFDPGQTDPGLGEILSTSFDLPNINTVEAHLKDTQQSVAAIFDRLLA
ncbi:MAG: bifunctional [glutamine synthetase] adenylyltransferase/[glutamine synthetase]-adenylyl-L-tyrosine phosphorylase [Rhizobiaceae bacterium]